MALNCPNGVIIYAPHNPQGIVVISQQDLGISDSNGQNFFFANESSAAAVVEFIDDATGTTVWSTTAAPDPQRNGSITNTGTTITYTQGQNAEDGDCITIKYYADNQQGTPDDECDQTFLLCLGDPPNTGNQFQCTLRQNWTFTSLPATVFVAEMGSFGIAPLNLASLAITLNGVPVTNLPTDSDSIDFPAGTQNGTYVLNYTIQDSNGASASCSREVVIDTGGAAFQCTTRQSWTFDSLPAGVAVAELGANGQPPIELVSMTARLNGQTAPEVIFQNNQIFFPTGVANGTYDVTYTIRDATNTVASCTRQVVINTSGTGPGPGPIDPGNGVGVGGPNCVNSFWTDGEPSLSCGDGPTQVRLSLRDANGNPVTQNINTIDFGLINMPAGGRVTPIVDDGQGTYTIEIDLTNVNCAGTFTPFVGYSL